ncbi:MAG: hypothetical protein KGO53_13525 [Alphaproteobacteria bacterium]|nr:hypothetical protein [Alphaproteobacteria bacterium]
MNKLALTALVAMALPASAARLEHRELSSFDVKVFVASDAITPDNKLDPAKFTLQVRAQQPSGFLSAAVNLSYQDGKDLKEFAATSCNIGLWPPHIWLPVVGSACNPFVYSGTQVPPNAKIWATVAVFYDLNSFHETTPAASFPAIRSAPPRLPAKK